jgi:FkbH-like protein
MRDRLLEYLAPSQLEVTDIEPKRILLIGACFIFGWPDSLTRLGIDVYIDRLLFWAAARMPAAPPLPVESYDLQLIQVPLPTVLPENEYMGLAYDDLPAYEALLERSISRLDLFLREAMVWSDRLPTFVMSYLSPQQNLMGRLLPRYDLRNPIYFIERLNMALDQLLAEYRGAHLLDTNHIASVYGRRFIQEDIFWHQFHGGFIGDDLDARLDEKLDDERFERSARLSDIYDLALDKFIAVLWFEVRAAYRTLRGVDAVKMLCVDLDGTLWRGVAAEDDEGPVRMIGWPTGLLEVLQYLKRRGIILAIVSKNDEATIRSRWDTIFGGRLRLEDFAIVKINWRPKAENVAEAIAEANVLPSSVVFLDDNPTERAAVVAAFPQIRALATQHYEWRRVLGWSAELQTPSISDETSRRTSLIQAQVDREQVRARLGRDEFLASLGLEIAVNLVHAVSDQRFARAFELINKTNQFNTTGQRWSSADAADYLDSGGVWWTFEAADRYSHYGLIGVACIRGERVDQFVMSCRVFGLDVELAALVAILWRANIPGTIYVGIVKETASNAISRDIFARLRWTQSDGLWRGTAPTNATPHIVLREAIVKQEPQGIRTSP